MITVPAHRVKQFGVEFFQASFSAKDIDRLVKFEVLGYGGAETQPPGKGKQRANRARVNWEALEKRIGESETAYQRPVIRRKIDELVNYYRDCKDAGTLPAIPGAVIITSEKRFTFTPMASQHDLGLLQIPEEHGVLRVLDGQHRLLALHALTQAGENLGIEVPAVLFDRLDGAQALPRSEPGPRSRRDPLAQRGRYLATRRRYQDARHRARACLAGAARRRDRGILRDRREDRGRRADQRAPPERQALLPELHEGPRGRLPDGVGGAEVLDQDRLGAARIHPRGARRHGAGARAQARRLRPQRNSCGGGSVGRASEGPPLRDGGRVEEQPAGRDAGDGGSAHPRAARRSAVVSPPHVAQGKFASRISKVFLPPGS